MDLSSNSLSHGCNFHKFVVPFRLQLLWFAKGFCLLNLAQFLWFRSTIGVPRILNYEDLPQDAAHLRTRLSGITENDLEWSIDAFAEKYETNLGHVGHQWERDEYNLEFRGNRPLGDRNHLAFGVGYRYMEFDVIETTTAPWRFSTINLKTGQPSSDIPILQYNGPDSFERFSAFVQNTLEINEDFFISFGNKIEDGDLSGTTIQPGVRASYAATKDNLLWAAYKSPPPGVIGRTAYRSQLCQNLESQSISSSFKSNRSAMD